VLSLRRKHPDITVARLCGQNGASAAMLDEATRGLVLSSDHDAPDVRDARVVVATARKWEFIRSGQQQKQNIRKYDLALIDEAYQMRSDAPLGIAGLFDRLMCVGDPGQLAPFTVVDNALWKGLEYSPSRTAMGTLSAFHPEIRPHRLPTSWRLPPSATGIVATAFYPFAPFDAGTVPSQRELKLGKGIGTADDAVLDCAATDGWAYVELPEKFTVRTDTELATRLASLVQCRLERGADVRDELEPEPRNLKTSDVAVVAAHNDQVHAMRYARTQVGVDPDALLCRRPTRCRVGSMRSCWCGTRSPVVANATAFHLEAGRMCVTLSRHRHACIVVGRAGASRLLDEFPDADPIFIDEPEKCPDGCEANSLVLDHLTEFRAA
jgi:hypothetical protein